MQFPPIAVQCERKPLVLSNGDYKPEDFKGMDSDDEDSMEGVTTSDERKLSPEGGAADSQTYAQMKSRGSESTNGENGETVPTSESGPIRPQASHAFEAYNRSFVGENTLAAVFPFTVDPPSIPATEPGYLYELSTRMLFASVDWIKGLLCFTRLCEEDKIRLLIEKWYLLFALGLLQCSHMFPVSTLLTMAGNEGNRSRSSTSPALRWQTFLKLKGVIMNGGMLGRVSKEIHEYMKIVTLFDQGKK